MLTGETGCRLLTPLLKKQRQNYSSDKTVIFIG